MLESVLFLIFILAICGVIYWAWMVDEKERKETAAQRTGRRP
jgi:hypothetical protein